MAETRQERIERIALRDAERKTKEQSFIKKGLPTLGWMAGLALPGAGITDVAGLYPEDMSGSGVMMPSMGQNIADKNYLDALYQGMGLFGDAAYASIPVTGPMGVLAGTTLKAGSAMGKAGRGAKVGKTKKGIDALPESEDYITAYHGSGADFDEFDIGKIGTGEGVQAFGHGLYFAEAEEVGKVYKKALGTKITKYKGKPIWEGQEKVGTTGDSDLDNLLEDVHSDYASNMTSADSIENYIKELKRRVEIFPDNNVWYNNQAKRLEQIKDKVEVENTGKLYETNLKVKPDELLDLDKRLNKQSKVIKKKLSSVLDMKLSDLNPKMYDPPGTVGVDPDFPVTLREMIDETIKDGGQVYETIGQMNGHEVRSALSAIVGPENTSKTLNSAGIKGNKYKDEFSRGTEGGTSNFVIFDDRVIDISKKYGITIPMAGAMLMAEDYKNTVEAKEFNQGGLADVDAGKEIYGDVPITVFENGEEQGMILPSKVSEETKDLYETFYDESLQLAVEDDFYYSPDKAFPLIVNEALENHEIDIPTYRTLNTLHRLHLKKEKDEKEWASSEKNPQVRKRMFPWMNTDPKAFNLNQGGEVFDPEGDGYDYVTAEKYALKPDESGHYPSRVPETGQLLKGKNHPTFHLTEREESRLGNIIFKGKDGFYYSLSENVNERLGFAGGGEVENDVSAYLRFYQYAKDAGLKFPEAVAAQASLESGHGKSDLAIYQNNVLGIKPDDGSQASESYDTLEYINGEPVVINDLFRTFDSQEDSFAGYKDKIDKPRYENAKSSGTPEDYLMAIDEAGYATDPNYAEKTIDIMNRYSTYLEN